MSRLNESQSLSDPSHYKGLNYQNMNHLFSFKPSSFLILLRSLASDYFSLRENEKKLW